MFSFLKPSSTVSIMKRIARVCQSMLLSVSTPGFERKSDRHAIKTDIVSISSFFSRQSIFLIVDPPRSHDLYAKKMPEIKPGAAGSI